MCTARRSWPPPRRHRNFRSEFSRDLVEGIGLDDVPGFEIVEVLDADAALVPLLGLPHIILEPTQRAQFALIHGYVVSHDPDARACPGDRSVDDIAAGDDADFGDREELTHF